MKATIRRLLRPAGRSAAFRRLMRRLNTNGLRCLLYHDIAESPSEFTAGLNVTTTPSMLAAHLELLARDYRFVSIDWVLGGGDAVHIDRPPLLITFDDAYASVTHVAAAMCLEAGAPSVFFVNGAFVNNQTLALDNLVAWTVNTRGMAPLAEAAGRDFKDLREFFGSYLAWLPPGDRTKLYDRLVDVTAIIPADAAADASLYVSSHDLASVFDKGMVIGNHTWSHVHCRSLDAATAEAQVAHNQRFLEAIVRQPVEVFSYPYGSRIDATEAITSDLARLGHRAAFLVEAHANRIASNPMTLSRVSAGSVGASDLFTDLEVLPVLRSVRNGIMQRKR